MKTNSELQTDVQNSIKREPLLHSSEIGIAEKDGAVSLAGEVDSYVKKKEAGNTFKKVAGVKALIENIEVKIPKKWSKKDLEIIDEVLKALKKRWSVPQDKVTVNVENGWVSLGGELTWNYQKEDARRAVRYLSGVKGVSNTIKVKTDAHDTIE